MLDLERRDKQRRLWDGCFVWSNVARTPIFVVGIYRQEVDARPRCFETHVRPPAVRQSRTPHPGNASSQHVGRRGQRAPPGWRESRSLAFDRSTSVGASDRCRFWPNASTIRTEIWRSCKDHRRSGARRYIQIHWRAAHPYETWGWFQRIQAHRQDQTTASRDCVGTREGPRRT